MIIRKFGYGLILGAAIVFQVLGDAPVAPKPDTYAGLWHELNAFPDFKAEHRFDKEAMLALLGRIEAYRNSGAGTEVEEIQFWILFFVWVNKNVELLCHDHPSVSGPTTCCRISNGAPFPPTETEEEAALREQKNAIAEICSKYNYSINRLADLVSFAVSASADYKPEEFRQNILRPLILNCIKSPKWRELLLRTFSLFPDPSAGETADVMDSTGGGKPDDRRGGEEPPTFSPTQTPYLRPARTASRYRA